MFITVVLTAAIWLTQSLRFIDFVMNRGLPMKTFFHLVMYLLPDLLGIILPIAFFIGIVFVYNRLTTDQELVVMRALGASNEKLTRPVLTLSGFLIIFLYANSLYFLPLSFQKFRDLEHEIRNNIGPYMIQPGEFNNIRDITVFVRKRSKTGELKGIVIHDATNAQKPYQITAEGGAVSEKDNGARIVMYNGSRQEIDSKTGKPSILFFDQYALDINNPSSKQRSIKPYERFLGDLLYPDEKKEHNVSKLKVEAHQRLLMPLLVLPLAIIALIAFLCGDFNRRGRAKRIGFAAIGCLVVELGTLGFLNLSEKFAPALYLAYGFVFGATLYGLYILWRMPQFRKLRNGEKP